MSGNRRTQLIPGTPQATLTPRQNRLVALMRQLHFGRIENLLTQAGEPSFVAAPRIVRKLKLGGDHAGHDRKSDDVLLKVQVVELLNAIGASCDGSIFAIEVRHGLPFTVDIISPALEGGFSGGGDE